MGALTLTPAAEAAGWWFGGGIGLGFGDVDYFEVNGIVGYQATPRFTPALRLTYRNRDVTRGNAEVTADDYGASLIGRYRVWRPFFAQMEYEYLSYEVIFADLSTERETEGSLLGGGGVALELSRRLGFFATALYNFTYDSDDPRSPYSSPWIFRTGIGYSF